MSNQSSIFKLNDDWKTKDKKIQPGLFFSLNITFECEKVDDYKDEIIISAENSKEYRLKLSALKPEGIIIFDPFVNFGLVPINSKKSINISFDNVGKMSVNIELLSKKSNNTNSEVRIKPSTFILNKNSKAQLNYSIPVEFTYEPNILGNYSDIIVVMDSVTKKNYGTIEVTGCAIKQQLSIVFSQGGGPSTELNFGHLYYGQVKSYNGFLVNNGPKDIEFTCLFYPKSRPNDLKKEQDDLTVTPKEVGLEMTERVLSTHPINGIVKAYSQIPLTFFCKTKVQILEKSWRNNQIMINLELKKSIHAPEKDVIKQTNYISTLLVRFEELNKQDNYNIDEKICEPITTFLQATAFYPNLVVDKNEINFWDVPANDYKKVDLLIFNNNEYIQIDFEFILPYFIKISSDSNCSKPLDPLEKRIIYLIFCPINAGKFNDIIKLKYVDGKYEIDIKIKGVCNKVSKKEKNLRGLASTDEDYIKSISSFDPDDYNKCPTNYCNLKSKSLKKHDLPWVNSILITNSKVEQNDFLYKYGMYKNEQKLKKNYNQFIKDPDKIYLNKKQNKNENLLMSLTEGYINGPILGLNDVEPIKPLEKDFYKEILNSSNMTVNFETSLQKKHVISPENNIQRSECSSDLSGYDLQKIEISTNEINFGEMFKDSYSEKLFYVKNNLKQHIHIKLFIDSIRDLNDTSPKEMVIFPGKSEVVTFKLKAGEPKRINAYIKYEINGIYAFKIKINCVIIPVHLNFSTNLAKFDFKKERLENPSVKSIIPIEVFNDGNDIAYFSFDNFKHRCFSIEPKKGKVNPSEKILINAIYDPKLADISKEIEEDIQCNLINGNHYYIKFIGFTPKSSVIINGSNSIDFGKVHVGMEMKGSFKLENNSKNITIWEIENCPQDVVFDNMCGYIKATKALLNINFVLKCNNVGECQKIIYIYIRGGTTLTFLIKANIIIPDIEIVEDKFNFPNASQGESKVMKLSLKNNSNLTAIVIADLRSNEFKNFNLELSKDYNGTKDKFIKYIEAEKFYAEDEHENSLLEESGNKHFEISIEGNSEMIFDFIFCPTLDIRITSIETEIAFMIKDYKNRVDKLTRTVKALKIDSKINVIPPEKIEFVKTFIYDKPNTEQTSLKIHNSRNCKIEYKIEFKNPDNVFSCLNGNGIIHHESVLITFYFSPKLDIQYSNEIIISIKDLEFDNSDVQVLKSEWCIAKQMPIIGEGIKPRIVFNCREIIMPIVPLNIVSRKVIKIKNEGFDLLKLSSKIVCDQGNLPLEIKFLDGNQLGQVKKEVNVEINFKSKNPISFTAKLFFLDSFSNYEQYILIAGTTENDLFTNYAYFEKENIPFNINLDQNSNYQFTPIKKDNEVANLEIQEDDNDTSSEDNSHDENLKENSTIDFLNKKDKKEKNSIENYKQILKSTCKRLLNFFKFIFHDRAIYNFPADFTDTTNENNYIVEFIKIIGGVNPKLFSEKISDEGRELKVRQQFSELLKFLQEYGASLNTVFPEYLLEISLFKRYISNDTYTKKILSEKNVKKYWSSHYIIHHESWILIIYQILKIFYTSRINSKNFQKSIKHLNLENNIQENIVFNGSNVYSKSQMILLKWMQMNYDKIFQNSKRIIKTFDEDLKDISILSSIFNAYFPKLEETKIKRKTLINSNNDQRAQNANLDKVLYAMKEFGIYTHFNPEDILESNVKDIVLFLSMLYQNLPLFNVKENLIFSCILGDEVSKEIIITNTSNKRIEYYLKKEGSDDFYVKPQDLESKDSKEYKIEPNSSISISISFKSRISDEITSKLYFINKIDIMMNQASPLVYELKSNITQRKSLGVLHKIYQQMYKKFTFNIPIKNPYKERGDFKVKLEIIRKLPSIKGKKMEEKIIIDKMANSPLYRVFTFKSDEEFYNMRLEPEQQKDLQLNFIPIDLCLYQCNIVFLDQRTGEFQYTVEGQGELPEITEKIEIDNIVVDEFKEILIDIKQSNNPLDKVLDLLVLEDKKKFTYSQPSTYPGYFKCMFSIECTKSIFQMDNKLLVDIYDPTYLKKNNDENTNNSSLKLSFKDDKKEENTENIEASNYYRSNNKLLIKFHSKTCATYETELILKNLERLIDIRRIKLIVNVKPKVINSQIEIICPIGEEISQTIPFYNNSDKDWNLKAELSSNNLNYFNINSAIVVGRKKSEFFTLKFKPLEFKQIKSQLLITNLSTKEKYQYALLGIADDPLSEGTIEISCKVREKISKSIKIANKTPYEIFYRVETDLTDTISGAPNFSVKANSVYEYVIKCRPLLGKTYFGKIIFHNESNKTYLWYTINLKAVSQYNLKKLELKCQIRKTIFTEFEVENPLNIPVTFAVEYSGEYLNGDKEFLVPAKSIEKYKLFFFPLRVDKFDGKIHIYSELVGEMLCEIKMISEPAPRINIPVIKAELGKFAEATVFLENPIKEQIDVLSFTKNKNVFEVAEKIIIPANSVREVSIRYIPSMLDTEENGIIKFDSSIGSWEVKIVGKGVPPSPMNKSIVNCVVGGMVSGNIYFKNPFNEKTSFTVELSSFQFMDNFKLITNNNSKKDKSYKITLDALSRYIIPYIFNPSKLTKFNCEIIIYASKGLYWIYPIEGITEVRYKGSPFLFKTKSKKNLETTNYFDLEGINEIDAFKDRFETKLDVKDEKYSALVNKCFTVELGDIKIDNGLIKLEVNTKFFPLRPFKVDCNILINKKSGGQWVFPCIMEALNCDPDDVLNIQAALNKTTEISFKLTNYFIKTADFIAYYTHNSSSEFNVIPKEGILDQSGRDGTQFIVTYSPIEYGKVKIANLIIETDEVQWLFEIRGSHTDYKVPEIKMADINKQTASSHLRFVEIFNKDFSKNKKSDKNVSKIDKYLTTNNTTVNVNSSENENSKKFGNKIKEMKLMSLPNIYKSMGNNTYSKKSNDA